jgi:hypothetical protein
LNQGIPNVKINVIAALTVMILAAAPLLNLQQQIMAQEQQQQTQSNQTTFDIKNSIQDLSFEIDNMTFSHHTASVNGVQLHYVVGWLKIIQSLRLTSGDLETPQSLFPDMTALLPQKISTNFYLNLDSTIFTWWHTT